MEPSKLDKYINPVPPGCAEPMPSKWCVRNKLKNPCPYVCLCRRSQSQPAGGRLSGLFGKRNCYSGWCLVLHPSSKIPNAFHLLTVHHVPDPRKSGGPINLDNAMNAHC